MRYKIIAYSLASLAVLLSNCKIPCGEDTEVHLIGTWQLDEKTHQAITHHCVEIDFKDTPATFILERRGEDLNLQFTGQHQAWMAPANRKYFLASQVLKSSASGRFCGFQTEISIYFRVIGYDQGKIKGTWRTTNCDICPNIDFIAYRID